MGFQGQAEVKVERLGSEKPREKEGVARIADDLMSANIRARIRRFMIEELEESGFREAFADDESLIEREVLDSLSILKLISFLDEAYGIFLGEEDLEPERFETVDRIVELILKRQVLR